MATVGQALTAPEDGWKRIDDTNENISYVGNWTEVSTADTNWYNNTVHLTTSGDCIVQFNFTGSKFRIVGTTNLDLATQMNVEIDGVVIGSYSQYSPSPIQKNILLFEAEGLSEGEHSVRVLSITGGTIYAFCWDVIDIDENSLVKPYDSTPENPDDPSDTDQSILRVTMIDSSEREYKLPKADIDGFVNWFTRTVGTGTTVYVLNKMTSSKEYLAFDKIISFEVIPVA